MSFKEDTRPVSGKLAMTTTGSKTPAEESDRCRLYNLFQPFVTCMSFFGMYFLRVPVVGEAYPYKPLRIYCTIVLTLTWANFLRYFAVYDYGNITFDANLCFTLTMHCWFLLCAFNCTIMYRGCWRTDLLRGFYLQWHSNLRDQQYQFNYDTTMKAVIRGMSIFTGIIVTFNLTFFGVYLFKTSYMDEILAPFSGLSAHSMVVVKAIFFVLYTYWSVMWMLPVSFAFIICVALYVEFNTFQKRFARNISDDGMFQGDFERFRKRHQQICRLVERADNTFSPLYGSGITLNLALSMLLLYIVIWSEPMTREPGLLGMISFWLSYSLLMIIFISISGGIVNHMAHAPLSDVYDIDLRKNRDISIEIQVFLSRLTGESIGLTAFDMFVIDKPTILTLFGVFVTYFLVLVQFRPSSSTSVGNSNCTGLLLNSTLYCTVI